jgi:TadE-like protein/Prokaryotic N-terminal methylation motif
MKRIFRSSKIERGQSLVELAISITILVMLLSGAVEFGIAFFQFVQLRDAAQEGALYGSLNPDDSAGITARVRGASDSPIDLSTITPDIDYSGAHCEGNAIIVTITFDHVVFMPFLEVITGGTIPLTATVTDTILTPICP